MKIEIHRLGLAAFIGLKEKLVRFEDRIFTFESDKTIEEWELEYSNSCCSLHDAKLCALRKMYHTKK